MNPINFEPTRDKSKVQSALDTAQSAVNLITKFKMRNSDLYFGTRPSNSTFVNKEGKNNRNMYFPERLRQKNLLYPLRRYR